MQAALTTQEKIFMDRILLAMLGMGLPICENSLEVAGAATLASDTKVINSLAKRDEVLKKAKSVLSQRVYSTIKNRSK